MSVNTKPGVSKSYKLLKDVAHFTASKRVSIIAAAHVLDPTDETAIALSIDTLQAYVDLWARLYDLWEASEHG